jgi:hypothetical protein
MGSVNVLTFSRTRLARDLKNRVGDDAYVAEEIIAELSSALKRVLPWPAVLPQDHEG